MSRRAVLLALLVSLLAYVGGYAAARAGHWIVHTSNYRHWIPEKRSPGHRVGSDFYVQPGERALNRFFKPLRVLEETYHRTVNPQ